VEGFDDLLGVPSTASQLRKIFHHFLKIKPTKNVVVVVVVEKQKI
jgi:hypothetical protein